ncbi:MAG: 50S ribosomal protein L6 [Planctomycetota bacterium]|nr:50S ribosomal protein L6 [Planctomycetota bacterium]
MSRIGKKPVSVPDNVKVAVNGQTVVVESGKNKLSFTHRAEISVRVDAAAKAVVVERKADTREGKALHGLTRALVANMIEGVTKGFSKELEVNGVGWTAKLQGTQIHLAVGFADVRIVDVPAGVKVEIAGNKIKVSGPDKQAVGQTAAEIRSQRPPEPYNGKGIKYSDEHIIRKAGKAFAGGGA